jgi:hypothetical protein
MTGTTPFFFAVAASAYLLGLSILVLKSGASCIDPHRQYKRLENEFIAAFTANLEMGGTWRITV